MSDDVGQLTVLRVNSEQQKRTASTGASILNHALTWKDGAAGLHTLSSSQVSKLHTQGYALTCGRNNVIKWEMNSFPEKTPLLYTYMSDVARRGVNDDFHQHAIFAIETKYLTAEMKFEHFGNEGRFIHRSNLVQKYR